jgi:hypothetical protein
MLAEISEREGEGGGHADALRHAQGGKDKKVWRVRKERGGNDEQHEA